MRYLFALALVFGAVPRVFAQGEHPGLAPFPIDPATHRIRYADTVRVAGVGRDELFTRALEWTTRVGAEAPAVDRTGGVIAFRASMRLTGYQWVVPVYSFRLRVLDGKVAYVLTDVNNALPVSRYCPPTIEEFATMDCASKRGRDKAVWQIVEHFNQTLSGLKQSMATGN